MWNFLHEFSREEQKEFLSAISDKGSEQNPFNRKGFFFSQIFYRPFSLNQNQMKIILNEEIIMVFTATIIEARKETSKRRRREKIPSRCVHIITTTENFSIENQNINPISLRGRKLYIFINRREQIYAKSDWRKFPQDIIWM